MIATQDPQRETERPHSAARWSTALVLLLALAIIVIGLWMLARRSSAAASDVENIGVNRLGAATLSLEVTTDEVQTDAAAFVILAMLPGDTAIGELRLTNDGSLPLRYAVRLVGEPSPLTDWLTFDVWTDTAGCVRGAASAEETIRRNVMPSAATTELVGDATLGPQPGDRVLAVGAGEVLCLGATLALSTPNEMQQRVFEFDIVVDAEHDLDATVAEASGPGETGAP